MSGYGLMHAEHHTMCRECEEWIRPGDPILNLDGEWVHADCGSEPGPVVAKPDPVCRDCNMVHAGECY